MANTEVELEPSPPYPLVDNQPFVDGQDEVVVSAFLLSTPSIAQVWELDSQGVKTTLLGSASVSNSGETTISLVSPLTEGEDSVGVCWDTTGAELVVFDVLPAVPTIRELDPPSIELALATSVTIKGLNFSQTMVLNYRREFEDSASTLSFTYVDSETITVQIPAQAGPLEEGGIELWAVEPGSTSDPDSIGGVLGVVPAGGCEEEE